jgi:hypothetical protein
MTVVSVAQETRKEGKRGHVTKRMALIDSKESSLQFVIEDLSSSKDRDKDKGKDNGEGADGDTAPCIVCQKECDLCCSCCQAAFYCSVAHQTQDWPSHRLLCSPRRDV